MDPGYVYCAVNRGVPGMFKIGYTRRSVEQRIKEINQRPTMMPDNPYRRHRWLCAHWIQVNVPSQKEAEIKRMLQRYQYNNTEFYATDLDMIKSAFAAVKEVTDDGMTDSYSTDNNSDDSDYEP